jgi:hypothetical protein
MQRYLASDRVLLAKLSLLGPVVHTPKILHFYTVSTEARRNYRPSLHYDPKNRGALPLRTWRLIGRHLQLVQQSGLKPHERFALAGSVFGRFGVRDFRRLAAESYHSLRILAIRAVHWRPGHAQ